ncbi:DUF6603 domain-containing protein [Roseivirga pacifica]|uniref:DUF6603 domain-containing protein n=1 Tax=Roseivirga pacifica TaxID=1267423 RepID=UPI0020964BEC|nr:DUF6603 domain-containing protein [Roseivirga pacifica]MCO6358754.1 hypothetical protein [Roseivirga pacifica]MCO6365610.1 hypothetical protein [Roseivirga pacifica]MCO6371660.1 hypothetical protein [Roseivirga pacifica]MCO6376229.1 hypothetical protein [Roseivirga pacifica]MCO6379038.1 hypothetical protein [Roseivirga pacifica]
MSSPGFLATHYLAITIDGVEIDLSRAKDTTKPTTTNEVAVLQPAPYESLVLDKTTVTNFSSTLGGLYPDGLTIDVKDVSLAEYEKPKSGKGTKVIAANFSVDVDVSKLPLVGHMFPKDLSFSVENIQVLFSTAAISDSTVLTDRLPNDIPAFPKEITKSANFAATLKVGEETITISSGEVSAVDKSTTSKPNMATGGKQSQGNVNKKFGPVFVQSVDLKFVNGYLNFVITGSIKLGPLTVTLDQLEVGSKLTEFDLDYGLEGLSVDYKKNAINIGGGLIKTAYTPPGGTTLTVYNGGLAVDLSKFQLSAIGSYTNDNGNPSLFVFANLDEPLGGPAFFFVTGLAFAFGINRNLIKPQVQDVTTFPLITAALSSSNTTKNGAGQVVPTDMNTYLPPQVGEDFLGIGVHFTSFKVINSFALLLVKFGKELEFDLLGVSKYVAPNPKEPKPVAVVELEVVGSYKPSAGTLLVRGMLTPSSYVFSKECHLQGGFAIAFWTGSNPHSGDFVFTFGGYGNHYTPQAYYPQNISELGFTWQINSNLSIKGGGYWTITPHRIVAGGFLKATYNLDWVRACFDVNARFEIDWSPLHYEGHFSVEFTLEVHIHILFVNCWLGFTIGEGLSIHGPEFGGEASIGLEVCTVDIAFGASPAPKPLLSWNKFLTTYTAAKETSGSDTVDTTGMVQLKLADGLIKTVKDSAGNDVEVVNPKSLELTASAFIPNSGYQLNSHPIIAGENFGIKPMGVNIGAYTAGDTSITSSDPYTLLNISISDSAGQFKIEEITEEVPRAMWDGKGDEVDSADDTLIKAVTGVTIKPAKPPTASETQAVDRSELAWNIDPRQSDFNWNKLNDSSWTSTDKATATTDLSNADGNRKSVLKALGFASKEIPSNTHLEHRLGKMSSILVGTTANS